MSRERRKYQRQQSGIEVRLTTKASPPNRPIYNQVIRLDPNDMGGLVLIMNLIKLGHRVTLESESEYKKEEKK